MTFSGLVLCFLWADFLTGFFHWLEDTYGLPTWPFIGPLVIVPNIEHHRNPSVIGSMGTFICRNYQSFTLALLSMLVAWSFGWFSWHFLLVAFFTAMGSEVHAWNHRAKNHPWVEFLKETCVVQTHKQHALHHKYPYDRNFCALGNVMNPILERLKFWRRLEQLLALFGVHPKRATEARQGF